MDLGESPIQLPESMFKVEASMHAKPRMDAAIIVCKIGLHPSPSSANEYIGRQLDPKRKDPPEISFKAKIKKPISDMVLRLWKSMGVPDQVCQGYKKGSLNTKD